MLAIFPSGATTVGRRGPVRVRARTATELKGSDCAGMPFAIVLLTLRASSRVHCWSKLLYVVLHENPCSLHTGSSAASARVPNMGYAGLTVPQNYSASFHV